MMTIPVETPNPAAAAAMRSFLGIIPTEDLPAAGSVSGTEKIAALQGVNPVFVTPSQIAALGGDVFPTLAGNARRVFAWDSRIVGEASGVNNLFAARWTYSAGGGGSATAPTGKGDTVGLQLRRGTGGAGFARVAYPNSFVGTNFAEVGTTLEFETTLYFPSTFAVAPDATQNWGFNAGFASQSGDAPGQNFAVFQWRWNGSAAEFVARRRRANGAIVSTVITPPVDAKTRLRVVINGQTNVQFFVNGALLVTDTTNIPIATWALGDFIDVYSIAGASNRGVDVLRISTRVAFDD
jgi:hypothetical protein